MVSVLCVAGFISFTDRLILSALVDPIRRDLALSDVAVSVLQGAAFAVVYVLAGPCATPAW
jgi:predicted MFS family arabinose efflux permease